MYAEVVSPLSGLLQQGSPRGRMAEEEKQQPPHHNNSPRCAAGAAHARGPQLVHGRESLSAAGFFGKSPPTGGKTERDVQSTRDLADAAGPPSEVRRSIARLCSVARHVNWKNSLDYASTCSQVIFCMRPFLCTEQPPHSIHLSTELLCCG